MVYLINDDFVFTLYHFDIEDIEHDIFQEYSVKEGIKLLSQYLKADSMLCDHDYFIYIYYKNILMCFISTSEDITPRVDHFHF